MLVLLLFSVCFPNLSISLSLSLSLYLFIYLSIYISLSHSLTLSNYLCLSSSISFLLGHYFLYNKAHFNMWCISLIRQGLLNKVSSPIEYHHLNKRHLQTKQDEEEKQEIFHIYKKHRFVLLYIYIYIYIYICIHKPTHYTVGPGH